MAIVNEWCEVTSVGDLLVRGAQLYPERFAVIFPESRFTYTQLLEGALQTARGLLALGIRRGDNVGLMSGNCHEFIVGFFATALIGCIAVPLNARHKAIELAYIIGNARLTAVLTTAQPDEYVNFTALFAQALPTLADAVDPTHLALPEAPDLRCAVLLCGNDRPGFVGFEQFQASAQDVDVSEVHHLRRCVQVRDVAVTVYTSGTTAHPKGCMLTHEALTRGAVERARTRFRSSDHDVIWGGGPLFHIGSLAPFIGSIGAGATYLTDIYFEPARALQLMMREGVTTIWPWFPAVVQALLNDPSFDPQRLQTLRTIILITPPSLVERVQTLFPAAEVLQACGMTETSGIFALSSPQDSLQQRRTSHGRPAPGVEIRLVDPHTGHEVEPGQTGEILVRGYCVMSGYYRDPEKTAQALDEQGWLHTGDLYRQDEWGGLVFNGRFKDMLKVGGENVAAFEVEAFLCSHPAVKLAEVVGRPDPRLDEVPVAFVELQPASTATEQDLIAFCKGRIANYKVPREIYFVQPGAWPMSATKVNKNVLRQRVRDAEEERSRASLEAKITS
ncbi:class I adenylate-forming enzyme family protein [Pseudomonas typographi]|uniref:class I adenylate-forming enzyme family protein n=1 Tax=Pseudomonas typographi TaxID=2715964 RepID=UPI0016846ECA|nr:class I adenylate-forming enzyme family protein [Pseudomonas typographi]MBD1587504.1 acyl--CoA ligase [Pseudomonas typographi]